MAFDKPTRNRLAAFVTEARRLITDEFTQQFQSLYGISDASLTELAQLTHLDDAGLAVAGLLRERIDYLVKTHPEDKTGLKSAVARLAREQAFTVLNRLAAVRMAEKRGLIAESVGNGYQSKGFKVFEQVARSGLGEIYQRYRRYLFCLFDELAIDLGVLFDRRSPQGLLFPRENTLLDLLNLLNGPELEPLWQEDETIGWIYQYYNDPAERKKMREESAAPRNSRELAVRNQFFTPRYVVEFLTDNTLGRIWYEMTRGETRLAEQCRYLVRRPTEIFLGPEETAPELPKQEGLSQEELLRQPVYIPHRVLKDPRQLRMLDPACGSMHFGLYAFDLYEVIYEEAWDRGMESLRVDFPEREALLREIPRLIIEHNIHGIDIDPRAVQIACLSLWLRAQRSWQQQRLPARQRPQIRRSNIVCAEPMPGDKAMLREFIASQFAPEEQPAFTFLLERVFDRMTLAGEAGSLLKIEEEISEAVREAKGLWKKGPQYTPGYLFAEVMPKKPEQLRLDLSGISDEGFWETAEERIYLALRDYAGQAESDKYQRRLFVDDTVQGFAFIDLCRTCYDVAVMNPPFGEFPSSVSSIVKAHYKKSGGDVLAAMVDRGHSILAHRGLLGAITSRTCLFLQGFFEWRTAFLLRINSLQVLADFGSKVMDDATVDSCAYVLGKNSIANAFGAIRILKSFDRTSDLSKCIISFNKGILGPDTYFLNHNKLLNFPGHAIAYWCSDEIISHIEKTTPLANVCILEMGMSTKNDDRWVRLWWEVPARDVGWKKKYKRYAKGTDSGGAFAGFYCVLKGENNFRELHHEIIQKYSYLKGSSDWIIHPEYHYGRLGLTYGRRVRRFQPVPMPAEIVFSENNPAIFSDQKASLKELCLILASRVVQCLLGFICPPRMFDVGYVQRLSIPAFSDNIAQWLRDFFDVIVSQGLLSASAEEVSPYFCNILPHGKSILSYEDQVAASIGQIDSKIACAYGFSSESMATLLEEFDAVTGLANSTIISSPEIEHVERTEGKTISYAIGIVFGRWDIRLATGEKPVPELPDPFEPLPVCPPGMLQGDDGLPLPPETCQQLRDADSYPLDIACGGILVDDSTHPLDIEHRLRDVFTVIWKDRAEAIELESCEILGAKSLRDYFRKPSGFFADHLKRYSKSRRQAPIYWPLSTAKGSYTLWIYYHRLSDQTLHTALADFVDPKIKNVRAEISLLRESNNNRGRLEELLDLEGELLDFQAEIERIIKLPWQPNLNDGVLITAAPLWRLFRLPKWQKDLKACWDKLEKGEYDWAHLAYSIWPKRVEEVCTKDRSIAIAHSLEHLCQVEPPKPKAKRGRKKAE